MSSRRSGSPTSEYASLGAGQLDQVRQACLRGDGIDPVDEATRRRLKNHGLGPADFLRVAGDDGFALALTSVGDSPTEVGSARVELTLAVRPESRNRGIGAALLTASVRGAAADSAEWLAWSYGDHPAARRLGAGLGFVPARALWLMRVRPRDQADAWRDRTGWPATTVVVRPYRPTDLDDLLAVNAAAFADHPEQGAMDATNLAERMAEPWFDPAGLLVATDDRGIVLGFHWTKVHSPAESAYLAPAGTVGEVYVIAVAPHAHGRGVGRVLLRAGLGYLADRGADQIVLYVESDNAPALALYHSLGFTHQPRDTHVLYRRSAAHQDNDAMPAVAE
ncbi:MAG: mycothiol synthase [Nocardioides sp.]